MSFAVCAFYEKSASVLKNNTCDFDVFKGEGTQNGNDDNAECLSKRPAEIKLAYFYRTHFAAACRKHGSGAAEPF